MSAEGRQGAKGLVEGLVGQFVSQPNVAAGAVQELEDALVKHRVEFSESLLVVPGSLADQVAKIIPGGGNGRQNMRGHKLPLSLQACLMLSTRLSLLSPDQTARRVVGKTNRRCRSDAKSRFMGG